MKTLILFLALILPNLTQANPGLEKRWSKTSFIADGSFTIKVFVNGRSLNSRPQSQVEALRLTPGTHRVRIVAYGPRRTKELRDVVQVRQNSSNQFAVKSASRNGGIYLDPIRLSNRVPARRGRLHDKRRRVREDFCEEAKYFNVDRLVDQMNCERFDSRKLLLAKDAIAYGQVFADDLKYSDGAIGI